jgi:hypothetical protein
VGNIPNGHKKYQMAKNIPNGQKLYQIAKNIPNGHKIYQMAIKYTKWPKIYQMAKNTLTVSIPRLSKIYPNWYFWYENICNSAPKPNKKLPKRFQNSWYPILCRKSF